MSEHNIEVESGKSLRLKTAGKYCDRDVVVTATGGGGGDNENPLKYATNGGRLYYQSAFPNGYELTVDFSNITDLQYAFYFVTGVKKITFIGNPNNSAINIQHTFRDATAEVLDFSQFCNGVLKIDKGDGAFRGNYLREIIGELDFSEDTSGTSYFYVAAALEEVRFKAGTQKRSFSMVHCSKLSDVSIQSIIDGLADLTGATPQTLTFHATVGAKLTEAQKATITAKNWTLVY